MDMHLPGSWNRDAVLRARSLSVIPDYVFIGIWLVTQLLGMAGGAPRIAWFAHLAGFAIGLLAAALFRASSSRP